MFNFTSKKLAIEKTTASLKNSILSKNQINELRNILRKMDFLTELYEKDELENYVDEGKELLDLLEEKGYQIYSAAVEKVIMIENGEYLLFQTDAPYSVLIYAGETLNEFEDIIKSDLKMGNLMDYNSVLDNTINHVVDILKDKTKRDDFEQMMMNF